MNPFERIRIEGRTKTYPYDEVKDSVVKIGDKFYLRSDKDRIVWVINKKGAKRAFRVDSPLLVVDASSGRQMLKAEAILTEEGIWFDPASPEVIKIGNKYHRRSYCVQTWDGNWALRTTPNLVKCAITGKYFTAGTGIQLAKGLYTLAAEAAPNCEEGRDFVTVTYGKFKGERIRRKDAAVYFQLIPQELGKDGFYYSGITVKTLNIVIGFQDKTNPQENRLERARALFDDAKYLMPFNLLGRPIPTVEPLRLQDEPGLVLIPTGLLDYFMDARDRFILPRYLDKTEELRTALNKNYSDKDPRENTAKFFNIIRENFGGKQNIYTPEKYPSPIMSTSFKQTGGLKYSYGVELETSQGLVPSNVLEELNLMACGDRSIGAGEYVTPPMMGDSGINRLKAMCEALTTHTLVDDRCAVHVHVGTLSPDNKAASPSFNKSFFVNAIRLGTLLEPEIYAAMPPSRATTLYHCHSIMRWKDINHKNYGEYMGAYLFGERENWLEPTAACPVKLFNFAKFRLGEDGRNTGARLGHWPDGRYKWLNLLPSYLSTGHKTIEFRIFAATTLFEKVYPAVMLSLAFTHVVDNATKLIKPGVTLADIFNAAFDKQTAAQIIEFYEQRKKKFNRSIETLYPLSKKELTFLNHLKTTNN